MSEDMRRELNAVKVEVQNVKADVQSLKTDVQSLKTDMQGVKADVQSLKTDMRGVKAELQGVKEGLHGCERRLGAHDVLLHNIAVEQARARGDIETLKQNMLTRDEFRNAMSMIFNRFDGFAASTEEFRLRWTVHGDTLMRHSQRLDKLESRA